MEEDNTLICYKCQKKLEAGKTYFEYLGHSFFTNILKCPKCGEVYIPEELAKGRMSQVEMQLEDK
ncbi:DVU_1557 family redox protein [Maledivibacter halophilus]|uniref:DUF7479 domain-containing protein n=1 Tax=Maledivibacter halophilus TaxID=36842 RepID=A0A1T5J5A5_9FIRM|nr:CLJU_RS11820 family redox protein [Maledivibacter halophilus]SKC46595.1 hypothetical protein SAMN02194393_00922 [Maledivibacter halophilus]